MICVSNEPFKKSNIPMSENAFDFNLDDATSGQVSITGMFAGLTAGNHTASMWVRTYLGTATSAYLDPGCWYTDVLIVKEYLPFGMAFLPMIKR